ncbi:MAG: hypothetical protein HRU20_23020 [Pseudomonadales bacterium]|nr:hypothetical protein [Pseudomonadales bacterium]
MFFRLMLWLMAKRIDTLVNSSDEFKQAMGNRVCVIQFKTANHSVARYFSFAAGKTKSSSGLHKNPALTFTFKSASIARNLILSMASDPSDKGKMVDAINLAKLRFEGDISLLAWFMDISDHFAPDSIRLPKLLGGKLISLK